MKGPSERLGRKEVGAAAALLAGLAHGRRDVVPEVAHGVGSDSRRASSVLPRAGPYYFGKYVYIYSARHALLLPMGARDVTGR